MDALAAFHGPQAAASAEAFDLCATYQKVKPILNGILPFLKLIPKVGAPAAAAIQALVTVLDTACPVGAQAAMVSAGPHEDEFTTALAKFAPAGGGGAVAAQSVDICATYKQVRPILKGILPFIGLIPVIGAGASAAITLLVTVLDSTCP